MKKIATLMIASVALVAASCSSTEDNTAPEEEVEVVESVTYTLDAEASSMNWKGSESEDDFHTGSIKFSAGSLTMKGEEVESGSFTVDMTSISVSDEMPEEKIGYLIGHLGNEDFFNVESFPTTEVTVGAYADGKLDITLNVLGQEIKDNVAVTINTTEEGATMTGDFTVDFASLNVPGFQPDPESGEAISSAIEFTLNIALTK